MKPVDIILVIVIALIVGAAAYYVYRSKKHGKKCIGCPYTDSCKGVASGCTCSQNNEKENK